MSKVILYIAMSLDGYIADEHGGITWLTAFEAPDEDYGYKDMVARLGTVIMGGKTYRDILNFADYPYKGLKTYVVTRGAINNPPDPQIEAYQGEMAALVAKIKAESEKDIWLVGGGEIIALFMAQNLVDEYFIAVTPVLLGKGAPLFPPYEGQPQIKFTRSTAYPNGLVMLEYVKAD